MIISLRGTNGSGKSTVALEFLEKFPHLGLDIDDRGRPNNYEVWLSKKERLYIIGRYSTQCGGCDGIQPYSEIWPRVVKYAAKGHVLFEGVLISCSYGNIGRASEPYGDNFVFAFLDTPLEECIRRVECRRKKKGVDKLFNPENLTQKWHSIHKSIPKIQAMGRRVEIIDHRHAFKNVCTILGVR